MKAITSAVITPMSGGMVMVKKGCRACACWVALSAALGSIIDGKRAAPVKYDRNPAASVAP